MNTQSVAFRISTPLALGEPPPLDEPAHVPLRVRHPHLLAVVDDEDGHVPGVQFNRHLRTALGAIHK